MSAGESQSALELMPELFQSAPAECRRENEGARETPPVDRFNPLPPTVGGRMASGLANGRTIVSIRSRRLSAGESRRPNSFRQRALRTGFRVPVPKCPGVATTFATKSQVCAGIQTCAKSRVFRGFGHRSRSAKGVYAISGPSKSIAVSRPKRSTMPSSRKLACK